MEGRETLSFSGSGGENFSFEREKESERKAGREGTESDLSGLFFGGEKWVEG